MKKLALFLFSVLCLGLVLSSNSYAQLFTENFDYPVGDSLINHGWANHSGSGSQITVTLGSLTYTGYQGSGIGNSTTVNGGGGSREDIHADFTATASGSLYAAFLVNVATAATTGDYFFHLAPAFSTTFFKPRLFVKDDGSGNLQFGISKSSTSTVNYTTTTYSYNTTYLLVLKYEMPAGDSNDVGSLYINPGFGSEPGTADIVSTDFTVPDDTIASVCLRQGSQSYSVQVDGIIIGTSWNSIFPSSTFSIAYTVYNGWNMVSFPGMHPNSMYKDTLYRFRDLNASVYSFGGTSYTPKDTLRAGTGYWLKHSGQRTYNWNGTVQGGILYPKLNTVFQYSSDYPIVYSGIGGWNMVGVLCPTEISVNDITTNPPGQIIGAIFQFAPGFGYQVAVTVTPSRSYWIRLASDAEIVFPCGDGPGLIKESDLAFGKTWATITITDAEGKKYTLYSTDKDQLDKYLLPPKPPADIFDVRYTSDRFVEDLSVENTIDITGAEYPIRITVTRMDISIKDAISGELVNAMLGDGEELVITNRELNKLTVISNGLNPMEYKLAQNYPNPFNPTTKINYTLPNNELVSLKVYNTIGEEVASLVNEQQQAGSYEVEFNSTGLASGIYLYKITAGNFVETKKMILLK